MRGLVFNLCLLLAVPAASGQGYEKLAMRYGQPRAYDEAAALPGGERPALLVAFRVSNQMLVFVRHRTGGQGRAFVAEPRVTVQVYAGERRVAEQVWQHPHYAATFEETRDREADLEGTLFFDLPPGAYTYRFRLHDAQAGREGAAEPRPVLVPEPDGAAVGTALLARRVEAGAASVRFDLHNLGGDAAFGAPALAVIPVRLPDSLVAAAALRYTLRRLDGPAGSGDGTLVAEGVVPNEAWIPASSGHEVLADGATLRWPRAVHPDGTADYLAVIDLHGDRLEEAAYVLKATVTAGDAAAAAEISFEVLWPNKPLSLYDTEVAIRNLHFIEGSDVVKAMRKGPAAVQEARLQAYWKPRDPTPATPFNELMAEYYRRVDHAAVAFRTGQSPEPDGLRTDRAALYIVHGPPDAVARTFPAGGGVEETWTYPDGRRFVFWAATSLDPPHLQAARR